MFLPHEDGQFIVQCKFRGCQRRKIPFEISLQY